MIDSSDRLADCVIIGGGPAGAACAIALKRRDRDQVRKVILIERERFPRYKVCGCCFNGSGQSVLTSLGCSHILNANNATPLTRWQAHFAGRSVAAELPTGWALSRNLLDTALLDHARALGVELIQPAVAKILDVDDHGARIEVSGASADQQILESKMVVVAAGLAGVALERWLPWIDAPSGPIGAGASFKSESKDYRPGVIYMACSKFGYAGIVRLQDQIIDVAAALYDPLGKQRSMTLGNRIATILHDAGMPVVPELMDGQGLRSKVQWKGTPQLHRQRALAYKSVIAVGDAAGYVEPFTGEGMAWALRTGDLAAACIAEQMWDRGEAGSEASKAYKHLYRSNLNARKLPCRILSKTLRYGIGRRIVFSSLNVFPWLAQPFIRTINAA